MLSLKCVCFLLGARPERHGLQLIDVIVRKHSFAAVLSRTVNTSEFLAEKCFPAKKFGKRGGNGSLIILFMSLSLGHALQLGLKQNGSQLLKKDW